MYPSPEKPYAGIFVKNQFEFFQNDLEQDISIYTIPRKFTSKIGSALKYIKMFFSFFPFMFKKFDVIHVHYLFPIALLATWYKFFHPKTKLVLTLHGVEIDKHLGNPIVRSIFVRTCKKFSYLICVGEEYKKEIKRQLNLNVDKVLSAGVDHRKFYPENSTKEFDLLFVGSFYEIKGIDILIEAIRLLNRKDLKYCFVGSGPFDNEIKKLQKEFDITILYDQQQDQLRELYNKAKWLTLPSRYDAFGLVVSESTFCGTPVIVTNIGGLKMQITDNENGFVIPDLTAESYAKVYEKAFSVSEKDYKIFVKNSLESNKQFRLDSICKYQLQIYKDICSQNG